MKIVIVRTVPGEILLSKVTYNEQYIGLARALTRAGHQCDIICGADKDVRTEKVKTEDGKTINVFFVKITKILKNGFLHFDHSIFDNYDIIQTIEYNQMYTWHLAKKYKDKYICYSGPYYSDFNKRFNLMAKYFDVFFLGRYIKYNTHFVTKSGLAENYLREKGIKEVKSIGVGIDLMSLAQDGDLDNSFYDEIDGFNVDLKLLYIGRIEPRRNSLFLVDVLKTVREKRINAGLVVIGKGNEDYLTEFKSRIEHEQLTPYVLYKSELEQKYLATVYKKADIFLLPTRYDIYGMVLLESMYFGMPVISSNCGGAQMMIESGKNGIVINEFDPDKWGEAVNGLYNDKAYKDSMGQEAHKTIKQRFTWDALTEKFISAYEDALKKHKIN